MADKPDVGRKRGKAWDYIGEAGAIAAMCGAYAALWNSSDPDIQLVMQAYMKMGRELVLPVVGGAFALQFIGNMFKDKKQENPGHGR